MGIKKVEGKWLVDLYPHGRNGKRVRKKLDTKAEALRFEKFILNQAHSGKEWNGGEKDSCTFNQLINDWYEGKGHHLKDGLRRKRCLFQISEFWGNPAGGTLKAKDFIKYSSYKTEEGCSAKTINNHLGYINAVFNYLSEVEEIKYPNPFSKVKMIKIDERELSWLTSDQISHLLKTIQEFTSNPHVLLLTKICLATGARWGEAEGLTSRNIRAGKITFNATKSGKSRSIPIASSLFEEIQRHLSKYGGFTHSLSAFRRALEQSKIDLPKGQSAHVLRHTFASHFMMNGGNILTLQRVLGHSSVNVTMRYAHLSPGYLQEVITKNPLIGVRSLVV